MRYPVMGAGALGSGFGGLLKHSGQAVTFIGRGPHFEHITSRRLFQLFPGKSSPGYRRSPALQVAGFAGRRTEIHALNGAICRYGAALGVPTPYHDAVSRLVRFLYYVAV